MINIYCDESCHLEVTEKNSGKQMSMVLGGITCPIDKVKEISKEIRAIKVKHNIWPYNEIKWVKVSNNKIEFYKELVEYFFDNAKLSFRSIIFQDKRAFSYKKYNHNDLYYIMYFYLLREMVATTTSSNIYIDKKDTRGGEKTKHLRKVLCNDKLDFNMSLINRIQIIDSKDSELMQLADLLIGAMCYVNRQEIGEEALVSNAKQQIVDLIKEKSGYSLVKTTLRQEEKFNIFIWEPSY